MAKASGLIEFLVENPVADSKVEVSLGGRLKGMNLTVRPMTSQEYNDWQKAAYKKKRRGNETEQVFDSLWFTEQIVINCVVEPNFKNADMLEKAGCALPQEFLHKYFLPGEVEHIADFISSLSGFGDDYKLEEKVKNS
mgnify:FL=1